MAASKTKEILDQLQRVAAERSKRDVDPVLGRSVRLLKAYQQARFAHTHAALLDDLRHRAAARFFLDHLYGPEDFSTRDNQFARVVPAMVRIFPQEVVKTVASLASLHAISEELDTTMAKHLETGSLDPKSYITAWQATAQFASRDQQLALSLQIGENLDRLTRNPIIRHSLRLMRGPARASGLSDLQIFLETGFEAFRAMQGAAYFLESIRTKEGGLIQLLNHAKPPYDDAQIKEALP